MRLTSRGLGLLGAGVALSLVATSLQSPTAARLAALVLGVPIVCLLWALVARRVWAGVHVVRTVEPPALPVGAAAVVTLRPTARTPAPWTVIRERVPTALRRGSTGASGYVITPSRRGVFMLGPAVVHRSDPLNLVRWRATAGGTDEVVVWPRTEELSSAVSAATLEATVARPHGSPHRNLEDLTVREYRRGDDMHRVHWKSSARHGELMVRHDEPSTTQHVDVLLELGPPAPDGDPETEWAVGAAASLAACLVRDRHPVRLLVRHGEASMATDEPLVVTSVPAALDVFARACAVPSADRDLVATVQARRIERSGAAVVVAVLRRPTPEHLRDLAPLSRRRQCIALLVGPDAVDTAVLEDDGWRTARATGDGTFGEAWSRLLGERVRG